MSNPPPGGLTTNQSALPSKFILGTNEETGFTYRESVKGYRTGLRETREHPALEGLHLAWVKTPQEQCG